MDQSLPGVAPLAGSALDRSPTLDVAPTRCILAAALLDMTERRARTNASSYSTISTGAATIMRDPAHRVTIEDLITYLGSKVAAMGPEEGSHKQGRAPLGGDQASW